MDRYMSGIRYRKTTAARRAVISAGSENEALEIARTMHGGHATIIRDLGPSPFGDGKHDYVVEWSWRA